MLKRRRTEVVSEFLIEALIRACGFSAIVFVFGIFFFVFREGSGFLFKGFQPVEFLTSIEWYPTSQSHVRYGVFALIAG
ncbi:MAG: phosphate ABC transporter permease subunit PstC, partial [Deltaproteobacteria bacterium]|nr:phosphate ABC transporter permease subunit PstC [Deltaproteobacteria bacterium]